MLQKRIEYDTGSISIRKNPVSSRKGNLSSMGSDDLVAEKLGDLHRWGLRIGADKKVVKAAGQIRFMAVDASGNAINKPSSMIYNGKNLYSDAAGIFTLNDKNYLDHTLSEKRKLDEYVSQVIDYITTSDDICQQVLGLNKADYGDLTNGTDLSRKTGVLKEIWDSIHSDEIKRAKCSIDFIESCSERELKLALTKLRRAIEVIQPSIVDESSKTQDTVEELVGEKLKTLLP